MLLHFKWWLNSNKLLLFNLHFVVGIMFMFVLLIFFTRISCFDINKGDETATTRLQSRENNPLCEHLNKKLLILCIIFIYFVLFFFFQLHHLQTKKQKKRKSKPNNLKQSGKMKKMNCLLFFCVMHIYPPLLNPRHQSHPFFNEFSLLFLF